MTYGPWSDDLAASERAAQLRSLAMLVAAALGSDHALVAVLRGAEHDGAALEQAHAAFERLPALIKRKLLSTFSAVTYWRPSSTG
jgi:hypothetical protein